MAGLPPPLSPAKVRKMEAQARGIPPPLSAYKVKKLQSAGQKLSPAAIRNIVKNLRPPPRQHPLRERAAAARARVGAAAAAAAAAPKARKSIKKKRRTGNRKCFIQLVGQTPRRYRLSHRKKLMCPLGSYLGGRYLQ